MDVKEDALKQILIKNIVTKRFGSNNLKKRRARLKDRIKNNRNNKTEAE